MSEPELGSDVAAIRTRGVRGADGGYTVTGQKMWLTNGGSSTLVAALVKTDEGADKPHRNLTAFLIEKPAGFGEVMPGLVAATGHYRSGIMLAPVTAEIVRELIDGETSRDLSAFSVGRPSS